MGGFGFFDLMMVAVFLGLGVGSILVARRIMRWEELATPREIARWERAARRRGRTVPLDAVESLALAARKQYVGLRLGLGIGALFVGLCTGAFLLFGGNPGPTNLPFLLALSAAVIVFVPSAALGLLIGYSRMKRAKDGDDEQREPHRLWDYCSPLALALPFLIVFANLIMMLIVALRLSANFADVSLARTFAWPGMWSALVAPAILLVLALAMVVAIWRFGALPLLALPRDGDERRRVDYAMRRVAIWQIVMTFSLVALVLAIGQFEVLAFSGYPFSTLFEARMEGWFLLYLAVMIVIPLTLLALMRSGRMAPVVSLRLMPDGATTPEDHQVTPSETL